MNTTPWYRRKCGGRYRVVSTVLWVAGAVPAMLALLIGNSAMSIVGLMLLGVGGVVCLIGAVRA